MSGSARTGVAARTRRASRCRERHAARAPSATPRSGNAARSGEAVSRARNAPVTTPRASAPTRIGPTGRSARQTGPRRSSSASSSSAPITAESERRDHGEPREAEGDGSLDERREAQDDASEERVRVAPALLVEDARSPKDEERSEAGQGRERHVERERAADSEREWRRAVDE